MPGRVARDGIQEYLASELDLSGDPNRVVNVFRPPDEVFNDTSLSSYDGTDVTIEHPSEMVNSENYKEISVGTVRGSGAKDGDFVRCDLIIKSKDAIEAVESGKCELSAGYTAEYHDTRGVTEDGVEYEFIQRDIVINHVALVDRARAGSQARIFDKQPRGKTMPKLTLDSGHSVEVVDESTRILITDSFDRVNARAQIAEDKNEKLQANLDAAKEGLTEAKKLSTDSAIASRVVAVAKVQAVARKIAGDKFTCDSVSIPVIQREALKVCRPKVDWADKSDVYVQASFDQEEERQEEDEDTEEEKKKANDSYRQLSKDASKGPENVVRIGDSRLKFIDSMSDAYKKNNGEAV